MVRIVDDRGKALEGLAVRSRMMDDNGWSWEVYMTLSDWNPKTRQGNWNLWSDEWLNLLAFQTSGHYTKEPYAYGSGWRVRFWDRSRTNYASYLDAAPAHEKDHNGGVSGPGIINRPRNPVGTNLDMVWERG